MVVTSQERPRPMTVFFFYFLFLITSNLKSYYRLHQAVEFVAPSIPSSNQELGCIMFPTIMWLEEQIETEHKMVTDLQVRT